MKRWLGLTQCVIARPGLFLLYLGYQGHENTLSLFHSFAYASVGFK